MAHALRQKSLSFLPLHCLKFYHYNIYLYTKIRNSSQFLLLFLLLESCTLPSCTYPPRRLNVRLSMLISPNFEVWFKEMFRFSYTKINNVSFLSHDWSTYHFLTVFQFRLKLLCPASPSLQRSFPRQISHSFHNASTGHPCAPNCCKNQDTMRTSIAPLAFLSGCDR